MIVFILLAIGLITGFFIWWFSPGNYKKPELMKLKPPLKQKFKAKEKPIPRKTPTYISSNTWRGSKQGYVFKNGKNGQGYYKDRKVKFSKDQVISYSPHESPRETGKRIR